MVNITNCKVVDIQVEHNKSNEAMWARIEAFEELDAYIYILERCDFDRGVTGALLENPVTLLKNIKRCVASKCSTEMTRTILLEGLV